MNLKWQCNWRQILVCITLLCLVLSRLVWPKFAERLDNVSLILLAVSGILFLVPLEKIKALKAGSIELSLDSAQVQGAVESLNLSLVEDEKLRNRLSSLCHLLSAVRGSRVLWIDDRPEKVRGERRLLRALGIVVVAASSSQEANDILNKDSDFDLILTDVQRTGNTHKLVGGIDIHEGVNFIKWLRAENPDSTIRELPVIFYAAYDWPSLVNFTKPVRETFPVPEISNSVVELIPKVLLRLTESRSMPMRAPKLKVPTSVKR